MMEEKQATINVDNEMDNGENKMENEFEIKMIVNSKELVNKILDESSYDIDDAVDRSVYNHIDEIADDVLQKIDLYDLANEVLPMLKDEFASDLEEDISSNILDSSNFEYRVTNVVTDQILNVFSSVDNEHNLVKSQLDSYISNIFEERIQGMFNSFVSHSLPTILARCINEIAGNMFIGVGNGLLESPISEEDL